MKILSMCCSICIIFLAGYAQSYDNAFTLNFNSTGDTAGWSDPVNMPPATLVTGETTAVDSPAYSPLPESAPGANGTGWMRIGQSGGDNFGVSLAIYDGSAGGTTQETSEFIVKVDMFVVADSTIRHQQGLAVLWDTTQGNFPTEFFYSHNTPGQPNGYGVRNNISGGSVYGLFLAETSNRWVRLTVTVIGNNMTIGLDRDLDGVDDYTSSYVITAPAQGKVGFFSVINDPASGNAGVPNQFAYFDNLEFTPIVNPVQNWDGY